MKRAILALAMVACAGCHRQTVELGHERGDCRTDKTCEPGLLCLSNLCVRPPPADCKAVAEGLASVDLGNYAEDEQRGPVIVKYQADCERLMVSKDEAKCLDTVRDKWSAGQCVPRMFPEQASSNTGDCAEIVKKTKAAMEKQATYVNDPSMKAWFERTMSVMQQSCEEDRWPDSLKKCMLAASDQAAAQACNMQMPAALQQKMQNRMVAAMQQMQQQKP